MFQDRAEAGRTLAPHLKHYADRDDVVVYGLPRGGVPVAHEVARLLHVPLDVFIVRKLGVPGAEELAMGAIASGGIRILNMPVIEDLGLTPESIDRVAKKELEEIERRESIYRRGMTMTDPRGKIAIVIDDGLATGATMRAAVEALRSLAPKRIVVAVPIGAVQTCETFKDIVEETICAWTPEPFIAVGNWYRDFSQTSDEEVTQLLETAAGL